MNAPAAKTPDLTKPEPAATSLDAIQRGPIHKPPRLVIYGVHGIGKTTFAASAPDPIIIPTEDGSDELDVHRFPRVSSTGEVLAALRTLYRDKHDYRTVIIDSADWLEDFIFHELSNSHTDKELAFGKEALLAEQKMGEVLTALNYLRDKKDMTCIVVAHSEIRRFDSPMTEPFDRYQPKLQHRNSSLLQEWADAVLFATYDISVKREDVGFDKKVRRGVSAGDRLLFTEERPAFYAKNRYSLPEELPLKWEELASKLAYFSGGNKKAK